MPIYSDKDLRKKHEVINMNHSMSVQKEETSNNILRVDASMVAPDWPSQFEATNSNESENS